VPRSQSQRQKNERITRSRLLLDLLQRHQTADFNAIATGDESWFQYVYPSRAMYARSRSDVISCVRRAIGTPKVMMTIFTGTHFLVLEALPKGRKFNQNYFLEEVLPSLSRQKGQIAEINLNSILSSIWTTRCVIMLKKSVWNWNIVKPNDLLTQLILPT
jgi:hypothetical protein